MELAGKMRSVVEGDQARLVHHLVSNGHIAGTLDDLIRVAVNGWHHRSGKAAGNAPDVQRQILGTVEWSRVVAVSAAAGRSNCRVSLLGLGGERGHLAVGTIRKHAG